MKRANLGGDGETPNTPNTIRATPRPGTGSVVLRGMAASAVALGPTSLRRIAS